MNEQILFLENIQKNEAKVKAIQPDVASLREVYKSYKINPYNRH